jgi:hypothetical protein
MAHVDRSFVEPGELVPQQRCVTMIKLGALIRTCFKLAQSVRYNDLCYNGF